MCSAARCLSISSPVCMSVYMPAWLWSTVCEPACLSACSSSCLPVCLPFCLSVCFCVGLSPCLPVCCVSTASGSVSLCTSFSKVAGPNASFFPVKMEEVLARLSSIKPPPHIKRFSKTFNISFWKASEYRNFLLLFSVPCCLGIVKAEYMEHWILLVEAIAILSKEVISLSFDIPRASKLPKDFCAGFCTLYG